MPSYLLVGRNSDYYRLTGDDIAKVVERLRVDLVDSGVSDMKDCADIL